MDAARYQRAQALFNELATLPPTQQEAALVGACGGDAVLEALLRDLLAADAMSGPLDTATRTAAVRLLADGVDDLFHPEGYTLTVPLQQDPVGTLYRGFQLTPPRPIEAYTIPAWHTLPRETTDAIRAELSRAHHPSLQAVYGLHETDAMTFVVLERLEGRPLRGVFDAAPPWQRVHAAAQLAEALAACHDAGQSYGAANLIEAAVVTPSRVRLRAPGLGRLRDAASAEGDLRALAALLTALEDSLPEEGRFPPALAAMRAGPLRVIADAGQVARALREVLCGLDPTTRALEPSPPERPAIAQRLVALRRADRFEALLREADAHGPLPLESQITVVVALAKLGRWGEARAAVDRLHAQARASGDPLEAAYAHNGEAVIAAFQLDHQPELDAMLRIQVLLDGDPRPDAIRLRRHMARMIPEPAGRLGHMRLQQRYLEQNADDMIASPALADRGFGIALLLRREDRLDTIEQLSLHEATFRIFMDVGRLDLALHHLLEQGALLSALGRHAACRAVLAQYEALSTPQMDRFLRWMALSIALENEVWGGDLDAAEAPAAALAALELSPNARHIAALVRATLALSRGEASRALRILGPLLGEARFPGYRLVAEVMRLEAAPPADDRTWAQALARLRRGLEQRPYVMPQLVQSLHRSANAFRAASAWRASLLADFALSQRSSRSGQTVHHAASRELIQALVEAGVPASLDGLILTHPLGEGGMGRVFAAWEPATDRRLAVKVLSGEADPASRRQLAAEVRALARLDHPNITPIYGQGRIGEAAAILGGLEEGAPYLVMGLARGGSLSGAVLDGPGLRDVALRVLDALAHAHARGLVHLDIKPANLLQDPRGGVMLADFGIARLLTGDAEGALWGTPALMAPEQLRGAPVRPEMDLYALGCTLWALATGRLPFRGADRAALLEEKTGPLPPFRPRHPQPPELEAWLRRLLAPDPRDRFSRAADAARALHPGAAGGERPPIRMPSQRPESPALLLDREPPLIGRDAEADALWQALRRARAGEPTHLRLVGPDGAGRSRLIRWLAEEGHARGLLTVIPHTPEAAARGPRVGLIIDPPEDPAPLLQRGGRLLVLSRATAGPGLAVPPLTAGVLEQLGERGLGLSSDLAADLAARAEGSPRFVVAAARLLVLRGQLMPSAEGFVLVPDPEHPLPDTIAEVVRQTVIAAAGPLRGDNAARLALSVRHDTIDVARWSADCDSAGVTGAPAVLEWLADARLLQPGASGRWRWQQPWARRLLRSALS